jgi:SAM-dependent methyltransferase
MELKNIKTIVKEKYGQIALQNATEPGVSSCCNSSSDCCSVDYTVFSESYDTLDGYNKDADFGLGCGIPTQFANINEGDHVLDLGSGAGNDCFVARAIVGETGKVTGLDFTQEMVEKATFNNQKAGFKNVEFVLGDIEEMPLASDQFDVVISNCVLNLVPEKQKAFNEILRVLKPGGHFCVSDVVIKGVLPENLRTDAEMYAGCVSGAIDMDEYLAVIEKAGFQKVEVHKQKTIEIPHSTLEKYLSPNEIEKFNTGLIGLFSITVSAEK